MWRRNSRRWPPPRAVGRYPLRFPTRCAQFAICNLPNPLSRCGSVRMGSDHGVAGAGQKHCLDATRPHLPPPFLSHCGCAYGGSTLCGVSTVSLLEDDTSCLLTLCSSQEDDTNYHLPPHYHC